MTLQKKYNGLDAMKLLMAFCVVGIHVNHFTEEKVDDIVLFLFNLAVPFFFLTSGFLLENKILKEKNKELHILKIYIYKNLRLYLLWTLIYTPIVLMVSLYNTSPWHEDLQLYLVEVLLRGSSGYAWVLWYVLALVVATLVIYACRKVQWSLEKIFLLGICFALIGYFIHLLRHSEIVWLQEFCEKEITFYGTNNGFFMGLPFISTGMMLRKYYEKIKNGLFTGVLLFILGAFLFYTTLPFSELVLGVAVFLLVSFFTLPDRMIYIKLRNQSMLVFFTHMYLLFFVFQVLPRLTQYNTKTYPVYIMIALLSLIVWLGVYVIDLLRKRKNFLWVNKFLE